MKTVKAKDTTKKCIELLIECIDRGENVIFVTQGNKHVVEECVKTKILPSVENRLKGKQRKNELYFQSGARVIFIGDREEQRKVQVANAWTVNNLIVCNTTNYSPLDEKERFLKDPNYVMVIEMSK